ncbi:MAG: translocation and assembly module TamB, partial [Paraglaciecola sp.]
MSLKRVAIGLATILLCVVLLFSPWGARALFYAAQSSVAGLDIEYASGGLGSNLKITRLRWQDAGTRIDVSGLSLDINWSCSMAFRLCLSEIKTEGLKVSVAARSDEQAPKEPLAKITLPIPVLVESLALHNISVDVEDTLKLDLKVVNAKLSMFQTLKIAQLSLLNVNINFTASDNAQPGNLPLDIAQIASWQYVPMTLPNLSIPLAVSVKAFQVEGLSINQVQHAHTLLEVLNISSAFDLNPKGLALKHLQLVHALGELQLSGTIAANLQHKIDMALNIQHESQFTQPLQLKLHAEGSQQDANIQLSSSGALTLNAVLKADLSASTLPLSVDIHWQNVAWPQPQASYSSQSGRLEIQGDLHQYTLKLDSDVAGADFPPTQLKVRAEGNQQQISLQQLIAKTLDGNIALKGVLNISDILDWQGDLDFSQLKPQLLWPEIVADIQGRVQHTLSYNGSNLGAEISELSASGTWQGYQLHARGSGAYDQALGVNIPLVTVSTGDNTLSLNGKLSPSQELMATVTLKADDFSQLSPSLRG